jgi:hypothetical protein
VAAHCWRSGHGGGRLESHGNATRSLVMSNKQVFFVVALLHNHTANTVL